MQHCAAADCAAVSTATLVQKLACVLVQAWPRTVGTTTPQNHHLTPAAAKAVPPITHPVTVTSWHHHVAQVDAGDRLPGPAAGGDGGDVLQERVRAEVTLTLTLTLTLRYALK